jgi:uncharacterized protein YndB with AHSA1/START domain
MKKSDPPIVIHASYPGSTSRLWNALTRLPEMKKWYFEMLPDFQARKGFKTAFVVSSGSRTFTHRWEILEVVPGSRLTYRWTFDEYPGSSLSTFEVSGDGQNSLLRLTVSVEADFPEDIPEFKRESCKGGWEYFLHGNLRNYLSP